MGSKQPLFHGMRLSNMRHWTSVLKASIYNYLRLYAIFQLSILVAGLPLKPCLRELAGYSNQLARLRLLRIWSPWLRARMSQKNNSNSAQFTMTEVGLSLCKNSIDPHIIKSLKVNYYSMLSLNSIQGDFFVRRKCEIGLEYYILSWICFWTGSKGYFFQ